MGDAGEQVEVGDHVEVIPPDTPTVASPFVDASEVRNAIAFVVPSFLCGQDRAPY